MDGWIKLHRKIVESAIFSDPDLLRLWIYCLSKAAYRPTTVIIEKQEILLKPGQFVTGRFSLHAEYNAGVAPRKKIKETTLWNWLKRLEKFGNLDIKSYNKYSVVTVVKWDEYQDTLTTEQQQNDNRLTTERQQIDTNKNLKNLEKEKKLNNISPTTAETETLQNLGDVYTRIYQTTCMTGPMSDFFMKLRERGFDESFCIELLLESAESCNSSKPSIRYLEKVRDSWIEKGITTREQNRLEKEKQKEKTIPLNKYKKPDKPAIPIATPIATNEPTQGAPSDDEWERMLEEARRMAENKQKPGA